RARSSRYLAIQGCSGRARRACRTLSGIQVRRTWRYFTLRVSGARGGGGGGGAPPGLGAGAGAVRGSVGIGVMRNSLMLDTSSPRDFFSRSMPRVTTPRLLQYISAVSSVMMFLLEASTTEKSKVRQPKVWLASMIS